MAPSSLLAPSLQQEHVQPISNVHTVAVSDWNQRLGHRRSDRSTGWRGCSGCGRGLGVRRPTLVPFANSLLLALTGVELRAVSILLNLFVDVKIR